jgi:hypothetical protein
MKNKLHGFAALGFLLTAFILAVVPVWADSVDEKIKALEQELGRLKGEQMELKKEATAAAAALPTFSYRPRSGVTMAAADRSWSWNMFLQFQAHMYNHTDGSARRGATTGDLFFRRVRPGFTLCVADCMYEWHITMDFDTGDVGAVQNTGLYLNFSKINPWLPDIFVGDEDSITSYNQVSRSSTSSAQLELASDLLTDSAVSNLSRRNIGFGWLDKPLMSLPGTFNLAFEYRPGSGITENATTDTDRKEFAAIFGARPFVRSKIKWLERLRLGISTTINRVDSRSAVQGDRLRIRTDERNGRFVLLDANNIGDGKHHNIQEGIEWGVGPYLIRGEGGFSRYHSGQVGAAGDGFRGVRGSYWRIGHELFVWGPKGLLTGGAYQPGSVQVGWGFQRAQMNCGERAGTSSADCYPGTGAVNNVRLLKRELDLWYHWNSFSRIGFFWNWWDADNVPRDTQITIGCSKNANVSTGKDCDWHSVNLALQVYF